MKNWQIGLSTSLLALAAVACGGKPSPSESTASNGSLLTLSGTVPRSQLALDNARAIALSADGHTYVTYVDANGDFTLKVPTGHAYRVVIANSLENGLRKTTAHLAIQTSHGSSTWIGARSGGSIDLGLLRTTVSGSTTVMCGGSCTSGDAGATGSNDGHHDDGDKDGDYGSDDDKDNDGKDGDYDHEGDHGDDDDCHQDDGEHDKVCKAKAPDVELHPSKEPGDVCDHGGLDDDKDKSDDDSEGSCDAPDSGKGSGKGGGGGSCSSSGGDCGSGSGGGYGGGGGCTGSDCGGGGGATKDAGSSGGCTGSDCGGTPPAPTGGSCSVNAHCGSHKCVASKCCN